MTVIELGLVIVILGVVFIFALKGVDLIPRMRTPIVAQQITNIQNAVFAYQTEYRELPGDDPGAPRRWQRPDALYMSGGAVISFVGDGKIDGLFDDAGNAVGEQFTAWRDLRLGGFLTGDVALVGQSARPENPFGGVYGFAQDNFGLQQVLCLTQVPGTDALLLDQRLDDGASSTGKVRAGSGWDPVERKNHFPEPDAGLYDPEKTYIVCLPYMP